MVAKLKISKDHGRLNFREYLVCLMAPYFLYLEHDIAFQGIFIS